MNKRKYLTYIVFSLSLFSLVISSVEFYHLAIFVDEFNFNPAIVLGGDVWLIMTWLKLLFLLLATIISAVFIFTGKKKS